jgi:hypothetical protein
VLLCSKLVLLCSAVLDVCSTELLSRRYQDTISALVRLNERVLQGCSVSEELHIVCIYIHTHTHTHKTHTHVYMYIYIACAARSVLSAQHLLSGLLDTVVRGCSRHSTVYQDAIKALIEKMVMSL